MSRATELAGWISPKDRLPPDETIILAKRKGEITLAEIRWEHPSYEDSYQAFRLWCEPNERWIGEETLDEEIECWKPIEGLGPDEFEFRRRIARLLTELNGEEVLSEQQCARYFGCDLMSWRRVAHSFSIGVSFVEGEGDFDLPDESPIDTAIRAALTSSGDRL